MQSWIKRQRILIAALVLATATPALTAEDHPTVVVVLDASGSMWGHLLDDQPKIAAAKQVVRDMLASWDPNVWLGLTVYGHRQKGACDDIEPIVPVGPVDAKELLRRVDAIQPKGKTPMTEAVRRAASELKYTESKAAVILVSDGEETCDADPCGAAKALEQAGVDLTVHTIGFDVVEKKGEEQLRCMAENTGGRFLLANDAKSLKKAIDEAVQVVVAAPTSAPTEPPPPTPEPTSPPPPTAEPPTPLPQAPAPAQNFLPRGGHGVADAVPLAPGDYVLNWELASNVFEFWKFQAKPGQLVKIVYGVSAERGYTGGALTTEKKDLVRKSCTNRPETIAWLPNAKQATYDYVVSIGGCNGVAKGSGLALSIEDRFDGGSSTDAGDDFESALEVKPGTIAGFLRGGDGDDERDYYDIGPVAAGKEIKLKIVPPTDFSYRMTIYDQDRVRKLDKHSANPGAVVRLAWTPEEEQEEVFVLVETTSVPNAAEVAPYKMEVEVK